MFSGSPLTPSSVADNDDSVRRSTRSGRTVAPSSSPQCVNNPKPRPAARSRKPKASKGEKPKTPKLTAPLSILTKDLAAIPVRNMKEWVYRSAETRWKEVEKRKGYVTRPMNSFMLYRSAYAERTKQWCLQNNHQIVSAVSGESWPMEPAEVREMYNEYAKIERINHQNAHPTYKFSPSKTIIPARKRKAEFTDEEEPSDLEDSEWAAGHGRTRIRTSRRPDRKLSYSAHSINSELFDRSIVPNGHDMSRSSWDYNHHEGSPVPMQMPMHGNVYPQYYQTSMHPNMNMEPVMEDPRMRRVDTPVPMHFSPEHALLGLPGGHSDLMQQMPSHSTTPLGEESQVDPMLLALDGSHHHEMDPSVVSHAEFRNGHMSMLDRELDQDSTHSLMGTEHPREEYHSEQWQPDPNMAPVEQGPEFEKWADDHLSYSFDGYVRPAWHLLEASAMMHGLLRS